MIESSVSAGKKASLFDFFITIGLVVASSLYLMMAAYSRDLLWFWPRFEARPSHIVIHCYGRETTFNSDSAEVGEISSLVNRQLSGDKRFDPLNLSDATYDYYKSDPGVVTLELVYSEPVRVHLPNMYFTNVNSLLLPLDGRHAIDATVFGLIDGHPAGGSVHVQTNQPIIDYLAGAGLCVKP